MLPLLSIKPLKLLGKLGKGAATILGVGTATAGGVVLSTGGADINETLKLILEVITALGVLLASFGIGRKAREAALK